MSDQFFLLSVYARILEAIKAKRFDLIRFSDEKTADRIAYLRHDVDVSLSEAVTMAQFEAEHHAVSTYFVMLDTDAYNVFSSNSRKELKTILELGHEIGLHLVPAVDDRGALEEQAVRECAILEAAVGRPITSFSSHRPAAGVKTDTLKPPRLINAYGPDCMRPGGYISDSNHHWRCGDPLKFLETFDGDTLQVLTHPIWWTVEARSAMSKIERILENHAIDMRRYLRENITFTRGHL